jgi:two-component system, sensor histidine kinase and response regulator
MSKALKKILKNWISMLEDASFTSNALCFALFTIDNRKLVYGNKAIMQLLKSKNTWEGLVNPTFDTLAAMDQEGLIFEGLLTLGDSLSVNTTIEARIYKKDNEIFLTGEINLLNILDQNVKMSRLNQEISILQRNLVKEKMMLANILTELKQSNEQLSILNNEKNRFLSMAAHDLRSPISTAISYADILRNDDGTFAPDKKERFLGIIEERLRFSLKLMAELLDISKIEAGSLELALKTHDYLQLIRKTIEFNQLIANLKDITILLECEEQNLLFRFDKGKLEQVINNLISNAIKYSGRGTTVAVGVKKEGNTVITSITDQGVGIKKDELPLIFNPFQKSSSRPTAGESSTGLGLAIAKKIVKEHGGTIGVESEENKGSCFSFSLPL